MKIITYVIVTWNNQNQIKACIDSIKNNTSISFDIFIIDNNSSDKTCEIIKKYFPDVILFRNVENLGFAKGNNLALKYVKSEYICFINPDIILTEDIVSPSINILNKEKSVGLVASRLCNLDGSHQPSCFAFATPFSLFCEILHIGKIMPQFICKKYFPNFYHAKKSFFPPWVIGAEMVMRTYEAKKINGFSTEYYMYTEDMDLCKKIQYILHKKIYFSANYSLIHLGGMSEQQNNNYNKQKKLFANDIFFINRFYGNKKSFKALKFMMRAYMIRLFILRLAYRHADRTKQINKTQNSIKMLRELKKC